jgi:hypothetical protein
VIRSHSALLRHAQDFFRSDLLGLYSWDQVRIGEPEMREPIPPNAEWKLRRRMMEEREGKGKYLEQERLIFRPWEILIYASSEKPPLGELTLRDFETAETLITGPLDPATWSEIGAVIRSTLQRKAS